MDIETFKKLRDDYKKAVKQDGMKLFKEHFKQLFDTTPNLRKIAWTQYTPRFSDGDPCLFGVYDFQYYTMENSLLANGDEDEDLLSDSCGCEVSTFKPKRGTNPIWASKELYKKFQEFERMPFDNDVFQEIFGEGKIIAARTKDDDIEFTVEEYEHE